MIYVAMRTVYKLHITLLKHLRAVWKLEWALAALLKVMEEKS